MQFFKDLVQAEPVYRSLPLKNAVAFKHGGAVKLDLTVGTTECDLAATPWTEIAGVYMGPDVTASGTIAAGTSQEGKVLVNPFAIYLAEYERDSYITTTNFSSGVLTATSEGAAGDWVLNVTTTSAAYGLLLYIASTSTTASMTALTTSSYAGGVTPGTTDNWVHIHRRLCGPAAAQYARINLDATGQDLLSASSYSGVGINLIDNHIMSPKSTSLQPLRRVTHNNTLDTGYKVFGEIMFNDTIWTVNETNRD
jgi:hypothetical protein